MKINLLFFLLLISHFILGQSHYASQQFGARSSFLGGAVIASVEDNSALFYNPAAIGFLTQSTLTINANMYQLDYINLSNGAGNGIDLNSIRPIIYPQLVSGIISFDKKPRLKMCYGLLTRFRTDIKSFAKHEGYYDLIPGSNGNDFFSGFVNYEINNMSQWAGLGLAYQCNDYFSIGLTQWVQYAHLDERNATQTSIDANFPTNFYTTKVAESALSVVDAFGLGWKLGVLFRKGAFQIGLNGELPGLPLFGFARMERTLEYFNQDRFLPNNSFLGRNANLTLSEQVKNLKAVYKFPASIGLGISYALKKINAKISFSAVYYFKINPYDIAHYDSLTPIRPVGSYANVFAKDFVVKEDFHSDVFNLSLAWEQKINDRLSLYFSIRTDQNSSLDEFNNQPYRAKSLNITFWNMLHFSSGLKWSRGSSDFFIGFNYGWGITNIKRQPFNLTEPRIYIYQDQANNQFLSFQGNRNLDMQAEVHSLGLILGYNYYIRR